MTYEPKFKRGDKVKIPRSTAGHDKHEPERSWTVQKVYRGDDPRSTSYLLKGSTSVWPETRLT